MTTWIFLGAEKDGSMKNTPPTVIAGTLAEDI
jgi:hypothetical protein